MTLRVMEAGMTREMHPDTQQASRPASLSFTLMVVVDFAVRLTTPFMRIDLRRPNPISQRGEDGIGRRKVEQQDKAQ